VPAVYGSAQNVAVHWVTWQQKYGNTSSQKTAAAMTPSSHPEFTIRENPDGSLDAICLKCYATAGTTMIESSLSEIEQTHKCDPALIAARQKWARFYEPAKAVWRFRLGDGVEDSQ
jgi:hypothetical protein